MNRKRLLSVLAIALILSMVAANVASAGSWSSYSRTYISNSGYRGLKADFKLPSIDAHRSSLTPYNFITFEEWLTVNNATDWFEIGFMDGDIDPGTGDEDYTGFYKAKSINGVYREDKLIRSYSVGTTYTMTIVDVNAANLYEVYIGSQYFGSFSDSVSPVNADYDYQGYEVNIQPGSPSPTLSSATIENQSYYGAVNGTWGWRSWSGKTVSTDNSNSWGLSASYSSTNNKTTITKS